jgi:hypothetical protein
LRQALRWHKIPSHGLFEGEPVCALLRNIADGTVPRGSVRACVTTCIAAGKIVNLLLTAKDENYLLRLREEESF